MTTTELHDRREHLLEMGGPERLAKQHAKGKMDARERLDHLLDPGSFRELDSFVRTRVRAGGLYDADLPGDGVVTGFGRIHGRLVFVYSQDFTVMGGSLGIAHAEKIVKVMDRAMQAGAPIIGLADSGGARIQEGVLALAGYAEIFYRNVMASGVIPQVSAILGPCAGGAVYSPAMTDFVLMVRGTSHMFITGPEVIEEVTKEKVSFEELGGADVHASRSGVATLALDSEQEVLDTIKRLLAYLPSNQMEDPPYLNPTDSPWRKDRVLNTMIPDNPAKPYEVREVIAHVVDNGHFFELQPDLAKNIVIGFARLHGFPVGIVANQPRYLAGVLDIDASIKAARFVRMCDSFNVPLVTFVDVPGFLPGVQQEHGGIIKHGAKLLFAYCEATVPKLTVILRKAYGGAYDVMASKHIRADVNLAWPSAEIAVMGPDAAIKILNRTELADLEPDDPRRRELEEAFRVKYAHPYIAAEWGYVEDIIEPRETRPRLIRALQALQSKRKLLPSKKHSNIPL